MRTFSGATIAALNANEAAYATLLRVAFPSGVMALNSSMYALDWNGDTYLAFPAGLGRISPIGEAPGEVTGASMELLNVDSVHVAAALDAADQVQGSEVIIATAIFDKTTHQVLEVEIDWAGYADTMPITRDGNKAVITLTAESKMVNLLRGSTLLYNDADQQSLHPGDLYFQYVVSQSDKPVAWPTKEWYFNK